MKREKTVKRKREERPSMGAPKAESEDRPRTDGALTLRAKVKRLCGDVDIETRNLRRLVEENNTKVKIKDKIRALSNIVSGLMNKELQELICNTDSPRVDTPHVAPKKGREVGTQTEEQNTREEMLGVRERIERLASPWNVEEAMKLLDTQGQNN